LPERDRLGLDEQDARLLETDQPQTSCAMAQALSPE